MPLGIRQLLFAVRLSTGAGLIGVGRVYQLILLLVGVADPGVGAELQSGIYRLPIE